MDSQPLPSTLMPMPPVPAMTPLYLPAAEFTDDGYVVTAAPTANISRGYRLFLPGFVGTIAFLVAAGPAISGRWSVWMMLAWGAITIVAAAALISFLLHGPRDYQRFMHEQGPFLTIDRRSNEVSLPMSGASLELVSIRGFQFIAGTVRTRNTRSPGAARFVQWIMVFEEDDGRLWRVLLFVAGQHPPRALRQLLEREFGFWVQTRAGWLGGSTVYTDELTSHHQEEAPLEVLGTDRVWEIASAAEHESHHAESE